jgi:serine phosphatase RsbU (regulator of sigma subunit)
MYTDGLYERRDDPADGLKRLRGVAAGLHHLPVAQMGQRLADEMLVGSATEDDVCVLIIRHPAAVARDPGRLDPQHPSGVISSADAPV